MSVYENIILSKLNNLNYAVYEYIEKDTDLVRYIGIVNNGSLANRHKQHIRDDWYESGKNKIRYIQCENQSETESIESHLISLYPEDQIFNKSKVGWGLNKYIPNDFDWIELKITKEDIMKDMHSSVFCSNNNSVNRNRVIEWIQLFESIS